jgi:hypothetical protein
MPPTLAGLTKLTLETAPSVCQDCVWWQTRGRRAVDRRAVDKDRWMEKVELAIGAFGTIYYDSDGHVLGSMQYGPSELFPRAQELPGGPPSDDAILVTCAYLVAESSPWVLQSLFLAAIGEARDAGAKALEAFSYRYAEQSSHERFIHRTVFPHDFLADFGFQVIHAAGRVGLSRLELGGLQPVAEGKRAKVLRVVQDAFGLPEPVPAPRP